jgi:hypothetical protein
LNGHSGFPGNIAPLDQAPIHLSLEEVTVPASYKVLMEVDHASAMIVINSESILGQQIRPHPLYLSNIIG